jgi:hypothetical protein
MCSSNGRTAAVVDSPSLPDLIERYVKLVRSVPLPLPLLIAIVWVKGSCSVGWSPALKGSCPARGSYA